MTIGTQKKKTSVIREHKPIQITSRAESFAAIREQHQREVAEDYLEAILDLTQKNGEVRVSELSEYFGVSMPTVNQHIKKLEALKYVNSRPYRSIFLTDKGKEIALKSLKRHQLIIEFLLTIGVPIETANFEAEGLEHHFSDATLLCLQRWIKKSQNRG